MPPWNHDKWTWRCDLDKQIRAPQEGTISKRNERTRENEADANSMETKSSIVSNGVNRKQSNRRAQPTCAYSAISEMNRANKRIRQISRTSE